MTLPARTPVLGLVLAGVLTLAAAPALAAGKGYHCEVKKNGKTVDDHSIKTRKECKKKGGKWVKADHDHDHDHEGEGEGEDEGK